MNIKGLIMLVVFFSFAQASIAAGLSELPYTFVQATYAKSDIDDTDVDADGIGIGGSFDVGGNVFVFASYASIETDDFTIFGVTGSVESSGFSVGLGYHHPLNPTVDFVPSVALIDAKAEGKGGLSGISDDDTGYSIGAGLRALVNPSLELSGGVSYVDLFDDDDTLFSIGAIFYPVEKLGVGAGYVVSDDVKTLQFGARVNF